MALGVTFSEALKRTGMVLIGEGVTVVGGSQRVA
ncbi:hypothetical protein BSY16_970 [Sinorhizobium sp. RAC02]|nr:hypothetical protein BSY16_970 [Sinorhizobium sp. RAC02]